MLLLLLPPPSLLAVPALWRRYCKQRCRLVWPGGGLALLWAVALAMLVVLKKLSAATPSLPQTGLCTCPMCATTYAPQHSTCK